MLELKNYFYFLKLKYNNISPFPFLQIQKIYLMPLIPFQMYDMLFFVVVTYMYKFLNINYCICLMLLVCM